MQYGLKKRTVTLFGGSGSQSTFALLERVARSFEPAGRIVKIARETDIAAAASQRLHSNGSVFTFAFSPLLVNFIGLN